MLLPRAEAISFSWGPELLGTSKQIPDPRSLCRSGWLMITKPRKCHQSLASPPGTLVPTSPSGQGQSRGRKGQGRAGPGWWQAQRVEPSCVGKLLAASWLSYSQPLSFYGAGSKRMLLGWLWEVFKWNCREQQENTAARVGVAALNTTL